MYLKNDHINFRKQKLTNEAIFALRVLIEKQIERSKIIFHSSLKKAFDSVSWNTIFPTLQKIGFEKHDQKILHSLYNHQTAKIKKEEAIVKKK